MSDSVKSSTTVRRIATVALVGAMAVGVWWYVTNPSISPRSGALQAALSSMNANPASDRSLVATAILDNFLETRRNAALWSGVYWGFTFIAALLSALAAMILKLESFIRNEGAKKDLAATFSIIAALLITISTSGDFQRKWQANRIAAAELESIGYEFLEADGEHARSYLARVGSILLNRNRAIVGASEARTPAAVPKAIESQGPKN
jgi:hypothetical protein